MKRVITLINQLASVSASTAALQVQADNANQTAKKYIEDNELLKQVGSTLLLKDISYIALDKNPHTED